MLQKYIRLSRPFTLLAPFAGFVSGGIVACYMNLSPAAPGFADDALQSRFWLGAAGGALLNVFANAINQIYDIEIDRINCPERPLPAGRMTKKQAGIFGAVALAAALALGAAVNLWLLLVFAAAAATTWCYSAPPARTKARGLWANATIALARGVLIPVAGWTAVAPPAYPTPWAIGAIMGFFLFGAASTKDFSDVEGDRANGIKTLPVVHGPAKAARFIAPFLYIPFLLIPVLFKMGLLGGQALPVTILAVYGLYIAWFMKRHYGADQPASGSRAVWIHMYLLMMLAQIGFALSYFFSRD